MKKETQFDIVKNRLIKNGYVDNFWAVKNNILRLGAIICNIRAEGRSIGGGYGKHIMNYSDKEKMKNAKNWHYYFFDNIKYSKNIIVAPSDDILLKKFEK